MKLILLVAFFAAILCASEAANTLVVINDATVSEDGTGSLGASAYVANHYVAVRGIPAGNVVHINSKGCCGFADGPDPHYYNNFHVSMDQFKSDIEQPIRAYLESHSDLKHQIKYIVTTYGVPTHIGQLPPFEQLSVDSFLSQMYAHPDQAQFPNPLFNSEPHSTPPHWSNVGVAAPIYLVCRLDGPSAVIANALVDKAMAAEKGIRKDSGTGYYDFQGNLPIVNADGTMLNGYNLCVSAGMNCVLNDQSKTHHMIDSAPNTLWAWGWYGGVNDVYGFAPGAVGAQLTSYTANDIRNVNNSGGLWVPWWLTKGITATWGATGEPYSIYYATGDNVLNHLWNGYTFGESAYIANSLLGWMMVFVGDPLYKPVFSLGSTNALTITPAVIAAVPGQAVQFTVSGLTASGTVTVASAGLTTTAQINFPSGGFSPIRINFGSTVPYADTKGNVWQPDTGFNPECTGLFNSTAAAILGSSPAPAMYQTNHYGSCVFSANLANGSYTVNLHFAEIAVNGPGRHFNVDLNGTRVLADFDIWKTAGGLNIPVVKSFPASVTNGKLTVKLDIVSVGPVISGIEILQP